MQKHWKEGLDVARGVAKDNGLALTHHVAGNGHLVLTFANQRNDQRRVTVASTPRTDYTKQYVRQQSCRAARELK